jgi:predicted CXXCH cytochrome family protein
VKHIRHLAVLLTLSAPLAAWAAGGHDAVGCSGCHSLHAAKGSVIFAVAPNTKYQNPKTNKPYGGTTALCLACHQDSDKGGQGYAPVSQHVSHPFDVDQVNPKIAKVPADMLRNGRFECMSCHDPHPSNTNDKYLRGEKVSTKNIDAFCAACHASKADPGAAAVKPAAAPAAPAKKK